MDDPGRWIDRHIQSFSQIPTYLLLSAACCQGNGAPNGRKRIWLQGNVGKLRKMFCIYMAPIYKKCSYKGLKKEISWQKTPEESYQTLKVI